MAKNIRTRKGETGPKRRRFNATPAPIPGGYQWLRDDSDSHDGNPTWKLKDATGQNTPVFIHINYDEDEGVWEVWEGSDKSGDSETIDTSPSFDSAVHKAEKYMRDNPLSGYDIKELAWSRGGEGPIFGSDRLHNYGDPKDAMYLHDSHLLARGGERGASLFFENEGKSPIGRAQRIDSGAGSVTKGKGKSPIDGEGKSPFANSKGLNYYGKGNDLARGNEFPGPTPASFPSSNKLQKNPTVARGGEDRSGWTPFGTNDTRYLARGSIRTNRMTRGKFPVGTMMNVDNSAIMTQGYVEEQAGTALSAADNAIRLIGQRVGSYDAHDADPRDAIWNATSDTEREFAVRIHAADETPIEILGKVYRVMGHAWKSEAYYNVGDE